MVAESLLILFLICLVPAIIPWMICAAIARIVMGRDEAFHPMEFVVLPLPGLIWLLLFISNPFGIISIKTIVNGIGEPMCVGVLYGALSLWRLLLPLKWPKHKKFIAIAIPCIGAGLSLLIFFAIPTLPE